ncbi:VOC family protein [Shigella flexneri]
MWRAFARKIDRMADRYCLFKLHEPVQVAHWQFSTVELPWPGEERYPHEGREHIEIVLPGDPETLNVRALALPFR